MYHLFFIHSSVEGYLGCFQVMAITNNAVTNIVEQGSLLAGSCGRLIPSFMRKDHTNFQSSCTNLELRGVPLASYPLSHEMLLVFLS